MQPILWSLFRSRGAIHFALDVLHLCFSQPRHLCPQHGEPAYGVGPSKNRQFHRHSYCHCICYHHNLLLHQVCPICHAKISDTQDQVGIPSIHRLERCRQQTPNNQPTFALDHNRDAVGRPSCDFDHWIHCGFHPSIASDKQTAATISRA